MEMFIDPPQRREHDPDRPIKAEGQGEQQALQALAGKLHGEFEEAARSRREHEQRWLDDLRQYRGKYTDEVFRRILPSRSRLYLNITKQKVDSTKARLMSLLFPSTSDENWSIQPTPDPDIAEATLEAEQRQAMQEGRLPRTREMLAREAADNMRRTMADQLAETQGRPNYRASCGSIIHQGLLHGTGILKGPLVDVRPRRRLTRNPLTGAYEFAVSGPENGRTGGLDTMQSTLAPYFEVVPIWDCYLDASTTDPEAMRFVWQTHVMNAKELMENLAQGPLFDAKAIARHIRDFPQGDWSPWHWEQELRAMGSEGKGSTGDKSGRYRVYERWGQLTGTQLRDAGVDLPPEADSRTYDAQVWMLGKEIIKIAPLPVSGFGLPYQLFYYHKDETSIWGEGLAWTLRDVQDAVNACIRMLIDNAAITSGPIIGLNVSALAPGEDPTALHPWKIFQFASAEDMAQAMTLWQMQSNTPEIMRIYDLLLKMSDEMSVPRYLAGDNTALRGAGETATGLGMLMNAANLTMQDLVRSFDDGITEPFIRNLYLWNMVFNPDETIKGDFDVVAVGSSSLMARELEGQRLVQAMQVFQAPQFAGRIKEEELLKEFLQKFNLPEHLLRSGEEFDQWQWDQMRKAALVQAQAQAQAQMQVLLQEMEKQGLSPEVALEQIMQMVAADVRQSLPEQGVPGMTPGEEVQDPRTGGSI